MQDSIPFLVAILAFGTVSALAFVVGQYVLVQSKIQRRLSLPAQTSDVAVERPRAWDIFVARHFDAKRFGVDETVRGKLRRELIKAGYFRNDALNYYVFARMALVIVVPALSYILIEIFRSELNWPLKMVVVSISAIVAIAGPDAFLARRQRVLTRRYQESFPDLLDLLVVCVDSGLSLEAAFVRITSEIVKQNKVLGLNLMMMGAEMRAGRSTVDALNSLADRLGLDEARSFVLVLRQSVELGSNIGDTLRVFSEEMREKRMLRAEESANKLPVKMALPLGAFIFPVILMVVMVPIAIRVIAVMSH